ncbi:hypothetical protein TCAL_16742 [Tigriopus californicus]|uniref:Secreted protein n=1 Tax=Tigriopus californicus TaxID=6832 RepID=A0A553PSG9_TIGCA|nr:hypothetical protein TCAL_16742 [Tigriopus californicus]
MIKSFIFPIFLALSGMAFLSLASPTEPEDPLPDDVQQYVLTEVKLVEGVEADEDVDEDEEGDSNGVQDRLIVIIIIVVHIILILESIQELHEIRQIARHFLQVQNLAKSATIVKRRYQSESTPATSFNSIGNRGRLWA